MRFRSITLISAFTALMLICANVIAAAVSVDPNGNVNFLTLVETLGDSSTKTTTHEYDTRDRLTQTTDRNGAVIAFGYDAQSNPTSYTDTDNVTTTRTFDTKNRLIKTVRAGLGAIVLGYSVTRPFAIARRAKLLIERWGSQRDV
jgi:YD repeat-containing protein